MANLKLIDQNGKDSGEVTLNDSVLVSNLMKVLYLTQLLDKELVSVKVLQKLRTDLPFVAVVRSLGDKKVLVVLVKVLLELHNGVVVELYLDQLQEAMLLS